MTRPLDAKGVAVSAEELANLCALDDDLFARTFFPQAMRQASPPMHAEVDRVLNDPTKTFVNLILPRDFAKTTKLRIFNAKRIAYGISRTVLYIAASEIKATQNIQWLKGRIEAKLMADGTRQRPLYASLFGLEKGEKWSETELKIQHRLLSYPIWVLGVGITSESIRGINFDDFRPDLIILDDILTDENGASGEQREKINNLVMAAVKNSLAPRADAPNAKMVMANTPQDPDDVTERAARDSEFTTIRFSCWTPETADLPTDEQVSAWEERHPTAVLRAAKHAAAGANRLSLFTREKECRLVSRETCMFRPEWLQFYDSAKPPQIGLTVLAIDPVPPPSATEERKKQVIKTDYEVLSVWRRYADGFYLLDYEMMRGHEPSWTLAKFFELCTRWRVNIAIVEAVAYQRVLRWILQQEMTRRKHWVTIQEFKDIKSKPVRIHTALAGIAQNGRLFVKSEHTEFIKQFTDYPNVEHDDVLDSAAMGCIALSKPWLDNVDEKGVIDNSDVPKLRLIRSCP